MLLKTIYKQNQNENQLLSFNSLQNTPTIKPING